MLLFLAGYALAGLFEERPLTTVKRTRIAMGTLIEIQVRQSQTGSAEAAIQAAFTEVARVEALLSAQRPDSPLWRANHAPTSTIVVEPEIYRLLQRSDEWWQRSDGAFDASLGALVTVWGFGGGSPALPLEHDRLDALEHSGWGQLQLLDQNRLKRPHRVELDLGGIGKGYAVQQAADALRRHGVQQALINAGGDIAAVGGGWRVGIQHPRRQGELIGTLALEDIAVATSGDYEQYFEQGGRRYHHILDPRSGMPAQGAQSVTVIAADCTDADALSTAVFVLGAADGLALVESLPGVESLIVDKSGKILMSSGFRGYLVQQER